MAWRKVPFEVPPIKYSFIQLPFGPTPPPCLRWWVDLLIFTPHQCRSWKMRETSTHIDLKSMKNSPIMSRNRTQIDQKSPKWGLMGGLGDSGGTLGNPWASQVLKSRFKVKSRVTLRGTIFDTFHVFVFFWVFFFGCLFEGVLGWFWACFWDDFRTIFEVIGLLVYKPRPLDFAAMGNTKRGFCF